MEDLKRILAGRSAFYSKADFMAWIPAPQRWRRFAALRAQVRQAIQLDSDRRLRRMA
jgi:XRE family aerobic/anaerobic benzoate catabolism transcriptional regulator